VIPGPDSPKWLFDSSSRRVIAQSAYGLHREIHVWPVLERRLMPSPTALERELHHGSRSWGQPARDSRLRGGLRDSGNRPA
jgi:hypothetical protein